MRAPFPWREAGIDGGSPGYRPGWNGTSGYGKTAHHPVALVSCRTGAVFAALLGILGVASIASSMLALWMLWTTDGLKSIGMVLPLVCWVLVLRAWRTLGWELEGSWWGLALLLATAGLVRLRDQTVLVLVLSPGWNVYFPPHSLVLFLYGLGVVVLFGGRRLARATRFPLALLLLSNPVPHVFNVWVDLPLQRVSAHMARAFAVALGQPLSPDKLRLMFTPKFGMFIAPGCNGIRGAVTMGLIALVAGYLYRFRGRAHAAVVVAAVALGYGFNLVRLCVLVLYYVLALHVPKLQAQAENADYVIGAALFFVAVLLLYTVIQRLGQRESRLNPPVPEPLESGYAGVPGSFLPRALALAALAGLGMVVSAQQFGAVRSNAARVVQPRAVEAFPSALGGYGLVRTWNETLPAGTVLFHWAEYAPAGGPGTHIAMGISPVLGSHDTMICHSARGEDPLWHGEQVIATGGGEPVSFHASFFNDGATQFLETSTLCSGAGCGEYATPAAHFGWVWSRPDARALLSRDPQRPIPILIKAETIDTTLPAEVARKQLAADVSGFLSGVDLSVLTRPYRRS